jgi:hypothetical protein
VVAPSFGRLSPVVAAFVVASCASAVRSTPQSAAEPRAEGDPTLGVRIAEGAVVDGRLWLRGVGKQLSSGGLVSLELSDSSRRVHFERGVIDLERAAGRLWVLRASGTRRGERLISRWTGRSFTDVARFTLERDEHTIALVHSRDAVAVLSTRSIREFSLEGAASPATPLKGTLREGVQVAAASPLAGGAIYVGINMGEWGGGLQRVDGKTGMVTSIDQRDGDKPCSGPLNSECSPVTGVIPDQERPDCVLAAVGLVHVFTSDGRIVKVCNEVVTVFYERPVHSDLVQREMSEAFYGLAAADDGFWAISGRALYRFRTDHPEEHPLPKLEPVSGIHLSRKLPGAVVVLTDINWAVSTSGYTPLVIPL